MSDRTVAEETSAISSYRIAIDLTVEVLTRRAGSFRNMVVTLLIFSFLLIVWAAIAKTPLPLVALLLVCPICGTFFILDNKILNEWRSRLLYAWVSGTLHLEALGAAIRAVPKLPGATLKTMLESLPCAGSIRAETGVSSTTRNAIAMAVKAIDDSRLDVIACRTSAYAIVAASLVGAAGQQSWSSLLVCAAIPLLWLMTRASIRRRFRLAARHILDAHKSLDFDAELCNRTIANHSWEPLPVIEKLRLLKLTGQ